MRARLALLGAVMAVVLALLLPTTALGASKYKANRLYDRCTLTGGGSGYGYAELTVKGKENARSGVNYMVFVSEVQEYDTAGGYWWTFKVWGDETTTWFPDDRRSHYRNVDRYYNFEEESLTAYHRIVITVQYWSDLYDLITTRTVYGSSC